MARASFSSAAKAELCRNRIGSPSCAVAEAYGVLLFCNTFQSGEIRIITTSEPVAKRLPRLFRRAFDVTFDQSPGQGGGKMLFSITDSEKMKAVLERLGWDPRQLSLHLNYAVLEDDGAIAAFFRGAFLAGGSVADPHKRYQLELSTSHYRVALGVQPLMSELGLKAKSVSRGANHITYFKQSEVISDFLTAIGAPLAAMEMINTRLEKGIFNKVNRRSNCDMANLDKAVEAAQKQIGQIQHLQHSGVWESLPESLRETARLRLANPELSLSQLAQLGGVSKSCMNHRLRKLSELSEREG